MDKLEEVLDTIKLYDDSDSTIAESLEKAIEEIKINSEHVVQLSSKCSLVYCVKTVEILVVKCPSNPASLSITGMLDILKPVPVSLCCFSSKKKDALVIKLPNKFARNKARTLIETSDLPGVKVSEPKKMHPKMVIYNLPASYSDDQVISSIINDNQYIKELVEKDNCYINKVFSMVSSDWKKKMVFKMSPKIREVIARCGWTITIGYNSYQVYDRIQIHKCRHCGMFGHVISKCNKINRNLVCHYCSGPHYTINCHMQYRKCRICLSPSHNSENLDCPALQHATIRKIENTDYGPFF